MSLSKKIITITTSIIISLLILEALLRISGFVPWKNIILNEQQIFKFDPILGWKAKAGSYVIKPINQSGKKFKMTFEKNGQRITGNNNIENNNILFIGGSFTQGWGVNDEDTFSSKLQRKYKKYKVHNFGQGGYGSVQSLLMLKEQIPKMKTPKLVIYGFIAHHEYRNVARARWLRTLAKYSKRGHVKTPYGYISKENELFIHPPVGYLNLPLREVSSLITLIEKIYMKLKTKKRKKQQKTVTKEIILKMKTISNKYNANFILLVLDMDDAALKNNYENFLLKNKVKFLNCSVPMTGEMILPGDYHPSEKGHEYYSECLSDYIKEKKIISN